MSLKQMYSRVSASTLACAAYFITGTFWRWSYILVHHDPRQFISSDMQLYIGLAKRWAEPGHVNTVEDVMPPPGAAMVFSFLFRHDPTLLLATHFQLFITVLVPVAVLLLGWAAFGKETGKGAMVVSSMYFPFIDYGGYFLTEIPTTLLLASTLTLFLWSTQRATTRGVLLGALASGVLCSVGMAFKFIVLPAMLCFVTVYAVFFRETPKEGAASAPPPPAGGGRLAAFLAPRRVKLLAAAALVVGALPLTASLTHRCTVANEGRFCFISNKSGADFLLGHYGRLEVLTWKDETRHSTYTYGSPSTYQHGYRAHPEVPFALTDGDKNAAQAWSWIRGNPAEAIVLSCEHVYDVFCGSMPWPSVTTDSWLLSEAYHFGFLLFLLLPTLFLLFDRLRMGGLAGFLESRELLMICPVFGLIASVFVATGEARYRVPFDSLFIVLAVELYRRYAPKRPPAEPEAASA